MKLLTNPVRDYAWGSDTAIARMQGRPVPAPGPEAELWMGAHPAAPSRMAATGEPLPAIIAASPEAALGEPVVQRYGARLPYLVKVLAAARALSLQVHPDAAQARAGFAAEQARGGAGPRNYVDPNHKPELLVALEPFDALCGFRDPSASAADLAALSVSALAPVIEALSQGPVPDRLRRAVGTLLAWPQAERSDLVKAVAVAARERGPALAVTLAEQHPADPGVVLALLLNHVRLEPDQAIYMPAGNLHAYLEGVGVEIMAASDNVLRCGLTPKHVDVEETTRILRLEVLGSPVVPATVLGPGLVTWPVPVADFALLKAAPAVAGGPVALPGGGPRIVACVRGTAALRCAGAELALPSGGSVFVAADEPEVSVAGDAVVFQASPGR
jgi:mannose-6-phosphate isomerase